MYAEKALYIDFKHVKLLLQNLSNSLPLSGM